MVIPLLHLQVEWWILYVVRCLSLHRLFMQKYCLLPSILLSPQNNLLKSYWYLQLITWAQRDEIAASRLHSRFESDLPLPPNSLIILDRTSRFTLWSKIKEVDKSRIPGSGARSFLGHYEGASWNYLCSLLWQNHSEGSLLCLACAWHCAKCFAYITVFNPWQPHEVAALFFSITG